MASTCQLWKAGILLGAGSIAEGSASITSWVPTAGSVLPPISKRSVQVMCTQAGTNLGKSFTTRIDNDNGSGTLTMRDQCPLVGA